LLKKQEADAKREQIRLAKEQAKAEKEIARQEKLKASAEEKERKRLDKEEKQLKKKGVSLGERSFMQSFFGAPAPSPKKNRPISGSASSSSQAETSSPDRPVPSSDQAEAVVAEAGDAACFSQGPETLFPRMSLGDVLAAEARIEQAIRTNVETDLASSGVAADSSELSGAGDTLSVEALQSQFFARMSKAKHQRLAKEKEQLEEEAQSARKQREVLQHLFDTADWNPMSGAGRDGAPSFAAEADAGQKASFETTIRRSGVLGTPPRGPCRAPMLTPSEAQSLEAAMDRRKQRPVRAELGVLRVISIFETNLHPSD